MVRPTVRQILDEYNQALPEVPANNEFSRIIIIVGERLPSLHASVVKQINYNRELKQVKMKKYEFLQTHKACRSFCSNEYLRGTDPLIILSISGHRSQKSYNLHNTAGLWNILKWIGHLKKPTDCKRRSKAAVCPKVLAPSCIPSKIRE